MGVTSVLIGVAVFSILITAHEWGHLAAAKSVGADVPVFSIGFGPVLWRWRWHGTEYRLSLVPLGGFVMMDHLEAPNAFSPWKRMYAYAAGPAVNFVLAALMFTIVGKPHLLPDLTAKMFDILAKLFTGQIPVGELAGPVGIVRMTGEVAAKGIPALLTFAGFLSLNLAVLNLLPIPILDGGQILIAALEAVIRRPLNLQFRLTLAAVSWIFILGLFAYITYGDIGRIIAQPAQSAPVT